MFPFKAYVVGVCPFYFLLRLIYPHVLWTNVRNNTSIIDPVANGLLGVFVLCVPVLLLGAVIQFVVAESKDGVRTLVFAIVPTLVLAFFVFLWVIAHLL